MNGNLHTDSGFKNADWKHFEKEFHKQTDLAYSRQSMQSKLSELKRKFVQLNTIKSTSGVGWDGDSCLPVATPAFIKAFCAGTRKKYNVMFTKKLDNYDILPEIFKGKVRILTTDIVFSCFYFFVFHFFFQHATGYMARSSDSSSSSGSSSDSDASRDSDEDATSLVEGENDSTGEKPFVPGLLDDKIAISRQGKMRTVPQKSEIKSVLKDSNKRGL